MSHSITRHHLKAALHELLADLDVSVAADDIEVALTAAAPLLFSLNVEQHLRDALSARLADVTGKTWPTHWHVWILSETEARLVIQSAAGLG